MRKIIISVLNIALLMSIFSCGLKLKENKVLVDKKADFTKKDVRKMVDYVHDRYRSDYTALPSKETLDWQKANVAMMYVHAYEILGDTKYLEWASDAMYVEFNLSDDQCWGANALLELKRYNIQPVSKPYTDDKGIIHNVDYSYQNIFDYTLSTLNGTAPAPYTGFYNSPNNGGNGEICWNKEFATCNSCTMGAAIILGYTMTEKSVNGKKPKEFASTWLGVQKESLLDTSKGKVYDYQRLSNKRKDGANYSYNYGTVLGALGLATMEDTTRHADAPQLADTVANYVMTTMTDSYGVLYSPNVRSWDRNACAFNGIFMHFVPYYLFSDSASATKIKMKAYINNCSSVIWKQVKENLKKDSKDYGVSYSWGKLHDTESTNCMTTVSAVECLLTSIQIKYNKKPFGY